MSLQEFFGSIAIMLAPLLFSVLGVFSSLKQIPWLHGILIILAFELYGVVTLVLISSIHRKCKLYSSIYCSYCSVCMLVDDLT